MSRILMHWRQNSRRAISSFFNHSRTTMMVCGALKSRTLTAIDCSSGVLVHECDQAPPAASTVVSLALRSRLGPRHIVLADIELLELAPRGDCFCSRGSFIGFEE